MIRFDTSRNYDAVVNCTGLEASKLCNDSELTPIRGQVIKVRAPWIKTAVYADNDTYIIPGRRSNSSFDDEKFHITY